MRTCAAEPWIDGRRLDPVTDTGQYGEGVPGGRRMEGLAAWCHRLEPDLQACRPAQVDVRLVLDHRSQQPGCDDPPGERVERHGRLQPGKTGAETEVRPRG